MRTRWRWNFFFNFFLISFILSDLTRMKFNINSRNEIMFRFIPLWRLLYGSTSDNGLNSQTKKKIFFRLFVRIMNIKQHTKKYSAYEIIRNNLPKGESSLKSTSLFSPRVQVLLNRCRWSTSCVLDVLASRLSLFFFICYFLFISLRVF